MIKMNESRTTLILLLRWAFLLGCNCIEAPACSNNTCNDMVVFTAHLDDTKLDLESKTILDIELEEQVFLELPGKHNLTICVTNPIGAYTITLNINDTISYYLVKIITRLVKNQTCQRHELEVDKGNITVVATYRENNQPPFCFCNQTKNIRFKISSIGLARNIFDNTVEEPSIGVLVAVMIPIVGIGFAFGYAKIRRHIDERGELESSDEEEEEDEEMKEETPDDIETNLGQNETNLGQNETNFDQDRTPSVKDSVVLERA